MKNFEGFSIRGANYNRNKSEKVVHPVVSAELHKAIEQYIERNYRPDNTPRKCLVVDKKGLFRSLSKRSTSHSELMRGLSYLLSKLEDNATFSEKVLWWIEKKERKPSEIYGKVGISKQLFAKIRSNPQYHPTKETVFAFAIALHLDKKDTIDLLKRAGYALSDSSISDTIVSFFIDNERYNIDEINEVLYEYECRTLTNWRDS